MCFADDIQCVTIYRLIQNRMIYRKIIITLIRLKLKVLHSKFSFSSCVLCGHEEPPSGGGSEHVFFSLKSQTNYCIYSD